MTCYLLTWFPHGNFDGQPGCELALLSGSNPSPNTRAKSATYKNTKVSPAAKSERIPMEKCLLRNHMEVIINILKQEDYLLS